MLTQHVSMKIDNSEGVTTNTQISEGTRKEEVSSDTQRERLLTHTVFLEWEIGMRLLYIKTVSDKRLELVSRYHILQWKLEQARKELLGLRECKWELENRARILNQDQECFHSLIKAQEEATLASLDGLQHRLKNAEAKLVDVALEVGVQNTSGYVGRVFSPGSSTQSEPPPMLVPDVSKLPPPSGGVPLTSCISPRGDLSSLSVQMKQLCDMDRIGIYKADAFSCNGGAAN